MYRLMIRDFAHISCGGPIWGWGRSSRGKTKRRMLLLRRAGCRSRSAAESSLHFDLCKIGPHEAHPLTVSCTQGMRCGGHLEIRPDIVEVGTTTMFHVKAFGKEEIHIFGWVKEWTVPMTTKDLCRKVEGLGFKWLISEKVLAREEVLDSFKAEGSCAWLEPINFSDCSHFRRALFVSTMSERYSQNVQQK